MSGTLLESSRYREQLQMFSEAKLDWERLNGKTLLITGVSGMIGKFLVDIMMERNRRFGPSVRITGIGRNAQYAARRFAPYMGNPCFSFCSHDVNTPFPEHLAADYVIHAASNTHPMQYAADPVGTMTANLLGTKNALDFASGRRARRILFLSSVEIYGENRGDMERFGEADLGYLDCNTLRAGYPESKRAGEALCQAYRAARGLDAVIARLSRIYGPTMREDDSKAAAQFLRCALERRDIVLKSNGSQDYSYTYAGEAAIALLHLLLYGKDGEAYNVAGQESTLLALARQLSEIAGTQVVFDQPTEQEKIGFSRATKALLDTQKLAQLGWKSHYTMKEGLRATLEILRQTKGGGFIGD